MERGANSSSERPNRPLLPPSAAPSTNSAIDTSSDTPAAIKLQKSKSKGSLPDMEKIGETSLDASESASSVPKHSVTFDPDTTKFKNVDENDQSSVSMDQSGTTKDGSLPSEDAVTKSLHKKATRMSINSGKSKHSSEASQIMAALGLDTCISDISNDNMTPVNDVSRIYSEVTTVKEDDDDDDEGSDDSVEDERGEEINEGGVGGVDRSQTMTTATRTRPGSQAMTTTPATRPGSQATMTATPTTRSASQAMTTAPSTRPGSQTMTTGPNTRPGSQTMTTAPTTRPGSEAMTTAPNTRPGSQTMTTGPNTRPGSIESSLMDITQSSVTNNEKSQNTPNISFSGIPPVATEARYGSRASVATYTSRTKQPHAQLSVSYEAIEPLESTDLQPQDDANQIASELSGDVDDDEGRGVLQAESPKPKEIEDDDRAEGFYTLDIRTFGHPGERSMKKIDEEDSRKSDSLRDSRPTSEGESIPKSPLSFKLSLSPKVTPKKKLDGRGEDVVIEREETETEAEKRAIENKERPSPQMSKNKSRYLDVTRLSEEGYAVESDWKTPNPSDDENDVENSRPLSQLNNFNSHYPENDVLNSQDQDVENTSPGPENEKKTPVSDMAVKNIGENERVDDTTKDGESSRVSKEIEDTLDFDFAKAAADFTDNVDEKAEGILGATGEEYDVDSKADNTEVFQTEISTEAKDISLDKLQNKSSVISDEGLRNDSTEIKSIVDIVVTNEYLTTNETNDGVITKEISEDVNLFKTNEIAVEGSSNKNENLDDEQKDDSETFQDVSQTLKREVTWEDEISHLRGREKTFKVSPRYIVEKEAKNDSADDDEVEDDFDSFGSQDLSRFKRGDNSWKDEANTVTSTRDSRSFPTGVDSRNRWQTVEESDDKGLQFRSETFTIENHFQPVGNLRGMRPISRSATDLRPVREQKEISSMRRGKLRPKTTQTMVQRSGTDADKEVSKAQEKENTSHQKTTDNEEKKNGDNKRRVHITENNDKTDKKEKNKRQNSDNSNARKNKGDNNEKSPRDNDQNRNKTKGNDTPRSSSETSDGRQKQKEFFKLELQRLETSLKRETSKIHAPQKKAYTPYVFNTLEPYYNTYTTRYLIELPDEVRHGHTSRRTAQGLTDPWLDLKMDRELPEVVNTKPVSRQVAILKREKELRDKKKRSSTSQSSRRGGGSTRLPKFPVVQLETKDLATKQLFYSDVPQLRHELKTKYSSSAKTKVAEDYERTQQDFYRMELDKLDEVHPINRKHMRSAYFAYLQNTPGSKKAINECVRGLKSGKA